MERPELSLIFPIYNFGKGLQRNIQAVLYYLESRGYSYEIICVNDCSTDDTEAEISAVMKTNTRIKYLRNDKNLGKGGSIKKAVTLAVGDYIIFTDGDCIPLADFVARHRLLSEPGCFLSGNRLLLSQAFTQQVLREKIPIHVWQLGKWLKARFQGGINRLTPLLRLPDLDWLRKRAPQRWQGAKTCNLSAYRADLLRVNGLDESYTGWGQEDSDLVVRLIRAGLINKSARFAAPVLHLWHKENDRSHLAENQLRLQQVLHATHIRAH